MIYFIREGFEGNITKRGNAYRAYRNFGKKGLHKDKKGNAITGIKAVYIGKIYGEETPEKIKEVAIRAIESSDYPVN